MKKIESIKELQHTLNEVRNKGSIGFVPTMGALHEGHLSLVKQSVSENTLTVVSVYVNPTQFNDRNDLNRYPRDIDKDMYLLKTTGCDIVFAPTDEEMYPEPDTRIFDFGALEKVMEGAHRPGHFNGVGQIVSKLFDAVMPHSAYFGLKDFQQLAVINKLVDDNAYPIKIVPCAIIREHDGLAMSSRNALLLPEKRKAAPLIFKTLQEVASKSKTNSIEALKKYVETRFRENSELRLEYFEIVDNKTLQPLTNFGPTTPSTACIAVFAGKVRLIDNIQLNL
jgi:pantoate--beta-alanine ligase